MTLRSHTARIVIPVVDLSHFTRDSKAQPDTSRMDLSSLLQVLQAQKAKCEEAIALVESLQAVSSQRSLSLEDLQKSAKTGVRGRKSMGDDERRVVSARMKAYWAKRRGSDRDEAESESPEDNAADPAIHATPGTLVAGR